MINKNFDVKQVTKDLINWIQEYFSQNGPTSKAVIGISGGKDSSVVAALCVAALGSDRVLGILMPCGEQSDIDYSHDLCYDLGITSITINIKEAVEAEMNLLKQGLSCLGKEELSSVTTINTPARIRMTTLYGVAGTVGGRVANTCNLSEDWIGYSTKFGDSAGDFSPLMMLTVEEVKAVGRELGLAEKYIEKVPTDGLCGKTDEDNLGFSYATLDRYIRTGICEDKETKAKIDRMHELSLHKLNPMPHFKF